MEEISAEGGHPCKKCDCQDFKEGGNSVTCVCGHASDEHEGLV